MSPRTRPLSLYACAALVLSAPVLKAQYADDDGVTWLGDYNEARRQSRATGKPIFVEFRCEA
jgi:hypothetical protein